MKKKNFFNVLNSDLFKNFKFLVVFVLFSSNFKCILYFNILNGIGFINDIYSRFFSIMITIKFFALILIFK